MSNKDCVHYESFHLYHVFLRWCLWTIHQTYSISKLDNVEIWIMKPFLWFLYLLFLHVLKEKTLRRLRAEWKNSCFSPVSVILNLDGLICLRLIHSCCEQQQVTSASCERQLFSVMLNKRGRLALARTACKHPWAASRQWESFERWQELRRRALHRAPAFTFIRNKDTSVGAWVLWHSPIIIFLTQPLSLLSGVSRSH